MPEENASVVQNLERLRRVLLLTEANNERMNQEAKARIDKMRGVILALEANHESGSAAALTGG